MLLGDGARATFDAGGSFAQEQGLKARARSDLLMKMEVDMLMLTRPSRVVRSASGVSRWLCVLSLILYPSLGYPIHMDGAVPIRLVDGVGGGECIDASKDAVSLHLRRLIVQRSTNFFSADSQLAVVLETRLQGSDPVEHETTTVTFPRVFRTSVSAYAAGLVSLPVEMRIVTRYPLSLPSMDTAGIDLDFAVIRKKGRGTFGLAIEHLAGLSENLVPPANPYGKAFGFFADYAKSVVDASIADKNVVDGELKEGRLTLTFSDDDQCVGDEERTGTIAVVQASEGAASDGFVNIATPDAYCWRSKFQPAFAIEVAPKPEGGCAVSSGHKSLANPHFMFVLNASREVRNEGYAAGVTRLEEDAQARCRLHHIALDQC